MTTGAGYTSCLPEHAGWCSVLQQPARSAWPQAPVTEVSDSSLLCSAAGVTIIDEQFLRSPRAMWELGVMMTAIRSSGRPQGPPYRYSARPAVQIVLPVVLMDLTAVIAVYEQHWTPEVTERACSEGHPPATLADLRRLLEHQGIRQERVRQAEPRLVPVLWQTVYCLHKAAAAESHAACDLFASSYQA